MIFLVQLIVAAAMVVMGLVMAARPYLLLDVVLTQEQLADAETRDKTLALMQEAVGASAFWWFMLGTHCRGTCDSGFAVGKISSLIWCRR